MSKVRENCLAQAINQTVALRRKIVDCRFSRGKETILLDKATELLTMIEVEQLRLTEIELEDMGKPMEQTDGT